MFSGALPLLVSAMACAVLEVPTAKLPKVRLAGLMPTTAPEPLPPRLMMCGDPAAPSVIATDPDRAPGTVGVKLTDKVQLPAAGTLVPQLSDSAKSPLTAIDEIANGALPMLRRRTVCGWLVAPIGWLPYCREAGLRVTDGAAFGPIFITKTLASPAKVF